MGLRFKVTDNKGKTSFVEKKQPVARPHFKFAKDAEKEEKETKEELVLNEKEIKVLKALAEKSEDLLALLADKGLDKESKDAKKADSEEEEEFEIEEEVETDDEEVVDLPDDEEVEENEEVTEDGFIDVDEELDEVKEAKTHDSKRSFGAIETKKKVDDSLIDEQEEINKAWAQRYSGGRK